MHQQLCKTDAYDISWIEGSQCLLVVVRDGVQGFRGVSKFFSSLRESRSGKNAQSWVLDLRQSRKIPDELWNWVESSWYPQLVGEGLRRQAVIFPDAAAARAQWRGLQGGSLSQESFASVPRAIMWLCTEYQSSPVRRAAKASRVAVAQI